MTIDLSKIDPRDYQHTIETALTLADRIADAVRVRLGQPRDLCEVYPLLPEDVTLQLWEVSDATLNHA